VTYLDDVDDYDLQASDMVVQSIHLQQLNNFTGNQIAGEIDYDADTNETITTTTLDRSNNRITVTSSTPKTSALAAVTVRQNGLIVSSSTLSAAGSTIYSYDGLGRTNTIQDPQGNSTSMTYDPNTGWLTSATDPAGNKTSYTYYGPTEANSGKLKCQTDANGKKTYYSYTTQGKLYQTWGDVPYPAEYRYNECGDLTNLITFRGGSGWTGSSWPIPDYSTGDNTFWVYDPASGALLSKIDAQGRSVNYTYDPNTGLLLTRSWARLTTVTDPTGNPSAQSVSVINQYDVFGDLVEQAYNDGTPSVQLNNYNRAGQPREIVDGAGTNELTYDYASRLVSSAYITGSLAGITVSNHFNPYYGRDSLMVSSSAGTGWNLEDDYGYDSYGRLGSVSSGSCSATYGYVPNSTLLQSTTFKNAANTVLTTTRSWNHGFQLASIVNTVNNAPVTSHAYQYDAVNRRTQATLEDGSAWGYSYNNRNELTGAARTWPNSQPVSGQQFGYAYDNIGNRQSASSGTGVPPVVYTANSLNQYTDIVTPGLKDIMGAALATNSVTVNGGTADRHGEYFHRQISVANTNQAVWQNVTNISGTFTDKGGLVFPANNQTLAYDADRNLTFDGIWNYQWDGENRLISMNMTNVANIADTNRLRLDFTYDYLGRRIQKTVSVWNSATGGFQTSTVNSFVYDGWNLFAILNPQSSILQSFVWGNDLSGTMTKAGGVGGLLMASISGTNCFTSSDGNGNITALINATDRSLAARYEYNPYGILLRETGLLARQNPFRYSSKYWDDESGLINYNARYYSPSLGKWIGRDPTTDQIFLNL
jgi:RHS repeat-associated protein